MLPIQTGNRVEIVYDFVCPWCYVGIRRLLAILPARAVDPVRLSWRPFLLNPDIPPEGLSRQDYVIRKYGGEERARRLYATLSELGAHEGIAFRFDRIRSVPCSVPAHRLALWADDHGLGTQAVEALFAAHFEHGLDLGNRSELAAIAARIGLDPVKAAEHLRGIAETDRLQAETLHAHRRGIGGVPCFVFDGGLAISGAQEASVFQRLLDVAGLERQEIDATCGLR